MFDISKLVKNLTPEQEALFKKHKANLRRTLLQAASEIGDTVWREVDDEALDAVTFWLFQRSAEAFAKGSGNISPLLRTDVPTRVTQEDINDTQRMASKLSPLPKTPA